MRKYNYFDDEPEYEESALNKIKEKVVVYAVCAYDALKSRIFGNNTPSRQDIEEKAEEVLSRRGRLLKALSAVLFLIFTALIVIIFVSNIHSSNRELKKYYSDAGTVCSEIMTNCGTCKTSASDVISMWNMGGLCYVRQLDFDGDNSDELLIAYNKGGTYFAEVWGYKSKEFTNFYRQPVNNTDINGIIVSFITVYSRNGKYYLGITDSEDQSKMTMLQLKGEEFKESPYTCEYDAVKDLYTIKGKISTDVETIRLSYLSDSKAERLVDLVNHNLDSFITKPAAEQANAPKTEEQIKADAYYNVAMKRIEKYGKPSFETDDEICFANGLAVVSLIDFDADGNDELLLISRKSKKTSYTDKRGNLITEEVPEYRLEVFGWQDNRTVKLFENDGVSQMQDKDRKEIFYILRFNDNKTVDICNNTYTHGKRSDKVWTGTSRISALEDGEFTTYFSAEISNQYGDMSYRISDEYVSRSTFNKKGYKVPYFCNEDDYDNDSFKLTYLQNPPDKSNDIKAVVDKTNKTLSTLNSSYIAN